MKAIFRPFEMKIHVSKGYGFFISGSTHVILAMDPKKREGGRILTVFFLPSGGKKKTVTNTQKMVEITEITKFGNI